MIFSNQWKNKITITIKVELYRQLQQKVKYIFRYNINTCIKNFGK